VLDLDGRVSTFSGPTIRTAVVLGFGVTLIIWLSAGYYFTRRIAEVERDSAEINARYMQAQELLSTVRAQILLGSVYVRDALLDPDPSAADTYQQRLDDTYKAIDHALGQYVPVLDSSAERMNVDGLHREIDDFHRSMLQVLGPNSRRSPGDARLILRNKVVPKREIAINVSEQVQALNRSAFVQQQRSVAAIYGATQRRVWGSLGLGLGASIAVGLFAILYAGRLEAGIARQRLKDVQNAHHLQRLSNKLITAQEEERRTIARELHDEVGQVLTTIKVELAVAQTTMSTVEGCAHLLDDARAVTDGALTTVRDLSHLLHPALLDDLGLAAAVEWYLRGFGKRHGLKVDILQDRMDERLAPETEVCAYRIIQEALTNAAKHARATGCRVYLQRLTNTVLITIEDDGVGFLVNGADGVDVNRGLGLISIRERVAQLSGTLRIESAPGTGTRLTVELPASSAPNKEETRAS
jgi:signal transduction histidine kinase